MQSSIQPSVAVMLLCEWNVGWMDSESLASRKYPEKIKAFNVSMCISTVYQDVMLPTLLGQHHMLVEKISKFIINFYLSRSIIYHTILF